MREALLIRVADRLERAETSKQRFPSGRPDSLNFVEEGMRLRLSPKGPVKLDREAVRFILHSRDQFEPL